MKRYMKLARTLAWLETVSESWRDTAEADLKAVMDTAPAGSGIDDGIQVISYKPGRIVLSCDFHHMNDGGFYDGWTKHTAVITPSLEWGFDLRITGKDRNGIKEYLVDTLHGWLDEEVEEKP